MNRKLVCLLAFSAWIAATPPARSQTARVLDPAFLEALRSEVRTNHPSVLAAQARVRAAAAAVRAVRLWDDPTAGLGIRAAEAERRRSEGDLVFSVELPLPRRGLYSARKSAATAERAQWEADQRSAVLKLETLATHAALELALADEALVIQSNQVVWLESITTNARQRLIDPKATAAEPLRLEGELVQERQRLETAGRQRTSLVRQLNTLLGRDLAAPWPALELPTSTAQRAVLSNVLVRLSVDNPSLQSLESAVRAARAGVEIAQQERKPLFSVGTDTTVYSGGRFTDTMIAAKMTLPWFNRSAYRAQTDRAREQQAAAELDLAAQERSLRGEVITAQTEAENAAHQAKTISQEVIPRLETAVQAIEGAWVSSRASLLEVLEARRALLTARLEQRRAVAAQEAALETLRSLVPQKNYN